MILWGEGGTWQNKDEPCACVTSPPLWTLRPLEHGWQHQILRGELARHTTGFSPRARRGEAARSARARSSAFAGCCHSQKQVRVPAAISDDCKTKQRAMARKAPGSVDNKCHRNPEE
eukprot:gene22252-biopygen10236